MKAVLIKWFDAVSFDPWEEIPEAKLIEPHTIHSLGWLLAEDDRKIVIAGSWDIEREGVASVWSIPKSWLLDMKEIDLGENLP
jgi:hypothetical protein